MKKYPNTYTQEDFDRDYDNAVDSICQIENGLLRRMPTLPRWKGYYMANTDKWYYAYRIEGDTIYIDDACHAQNMHESKIEAQFSALNEWMAKLGCLNEYSYERLLESQRDILAESQESKSISAAKKLVMQRLGYDEQRADQFVRVELRQDLPTLRDKNAAKFILGVTRMFCDRQIQDARTIQQLNNTLKYVASEAHISEYDRDLNGMSAQELIQRFAKNVEADIQADRDAVANQRYQRNSDYQIVPVNSFKDARKYGKYTSWCVTHYEDMFNSYTHNGIGKFYFCLKKGFENIYEHVGENCPLDEYGLSMVAVSVDENGNLLTCTCRWNHDNGGNDNIMDTKQISNLIGKNFYDVFKPNDKWQGILNYAIARLKKGERLRNVVDYCGDFYNGYAAVKLKDKWNFIDTKGNLLSPDRWFDDCWDFGKGYACVELNGKWDWVDTNGNILFPDRWFEKCGDFYNGYAAVKLKDKWNFIDTKGNLLSPDRWFEKCRAFNNGYAAVKLNGKCNWVDTNGNILFPDRWFEKCGNFYNGYARVELNGKGYYIDADGNLYYLNTQQFIRNLMESSENRRKKRLTESDIQGIVRESIRKFMNSHRKKAQQLTNQKNNDH